ncbi:hypothetical protein [Kocuria rosea]|uniref:hypothetical protein n=1 Tax=Kocuria rosea TaxID=1275 RepID=UPI00301B5AF5
MTSIGDLVQRVLTWNPRALATPRPISYIDIASVNNRTKQIENPQLIISNEAPSRARQIVAANDVLVSTVRPGLNAVALVPESLNGATASTGFTVLRPGPELDSELLFHYVQSNWFVNYLVNHATGASYPAVSDKIIKSCPIPKLPIDEQRRVARTLSTAADMTRHAIQIDQNLDHILLRRAKMIHDRPSTSRIELSAFVKSFVSGKSFSDADITSPEAWSVLRVSSVSSGKFRRDQAKPLDKNYCPPENHRVRQGDVLINRSNTRELVGSAAIVDDPKGRLAVPDKIWRVEWRDSQPSPHYFITTLREPSIRLAIQDMATGTSASMLNISKDRMLRLKIPWPSYCERESFESFANSVESMRQLAQRQRIGAYELYKSLQSRAFQG